MMAYKVGEKILVIGKIIRINSHPPTEAFPYQVDFGGGALVWIEKNIIRPYIPEKVEIEEGMHVKVIVNHQEITGVTTHYHLAKDEWYIDVDDGFDIITASVPTGYLLPIIPE
jgi:hypothetical protein